MLGLTLRFTLWLLLWGYSALGCFMCFVCSRCAVCFEFLIMGFELVVLRFVYMNLIDAWGLFDCRALRVVLFWFV